VILKEITRTFSTNIMMNFLISYTYDIKLKNIF